MSQPFNYSHFAGQPPPYQGQPQAPPRPYQYAPAPIQPASSFYASPASATEPSPTTVANNYASINGSFQYNGSSIPGLGISATPTKAYRVETNTGYQPTSTAPSSPAFVAPLAQPQNIVGLREAISPYAPGPSGVAQSPLPTASRHSEEEGELTGGEFEDLYEPRGSNDSEAARKQPSGQEAGATEDAGSMGDADGSSIYDTGSNREEVVIDSTSASLPPPDEDDDYEPHEYEPEYQPRENSRSYSPHLSPVEVRHEDPATKRVVSKADESASVPHSAPSFATAANSASTQAPIGSNSSSQNPKQPSLPYKTVSEAKKKAQEAILGLWPLKVRYQNYLDEGLDPQLVKALFTELGLDVSSLKPVAPVSKAPLDAPTSTVAEANKVAVQSSPKATAHASDSVQGSAAPQPRKPDSGKPAINGEPKTTEKKSPQEERKDKIARMLAEKSKKSASQPAPTAAPKAPAATATNTSKPTAEPSEAAKAKLRAENTKKILEKMAALKKQQEKKPEATENSAATPATNDTNASTAASTAPAATTPQPPAVGSFASECSSSVAIPAPPGPSVVSSPQPNAKHRAMKRPVAADFDGYPPNGNTLKRTRTQETLIIDVSDDEDVEMDLGSPTEPAGSTAQNSGITRQNSLASYPPLTNSRSWRGPGSGAATPGTATPSIRGHKLDFLTQKIEEAKRQIAEAEAKKAAKKTNGTSTPVAQSPVPPSGPIESARLPKPSEFSRSPANSERRDRIASYHLPVVEAALREKQEKLQRLQSEAAQLELEVQATLAERQKLAVEMATLDISTESESDKPNGVSEPSDSDTNTPLEAQPSIMEAITRDAQHDVAESLSVPELPSTAQEDASLSGDNDSVMDIDSDSSSVAGDSGDIITSAVNVTTNDGTQSNAVDGPSAGQPLHLPSVIPNGSDEGQEFGSSNNDERFEHTTAPLVAEAEDQPSADADVPMQISDAEDDDCYEPMPAQISGADKVQIAEGEDGEVPDEDPYEPSPAQGSAAAAETVPEAKTDEAESQSSLSEKDLLSYQSPLRYFHAYRFHPKYLDDVSGGLKSMTYSSRIDISRPICPFLLDGGQCPNGSGCEFQHFDKMVLSDTAIIAELGSTDMYEGEQKCRFIDGLKKVLQDLKANKVKDFDSITKAIVAYRADFLGDKSKVLPLSNVTV